MINVVIVDDHELVRSGIQRILLDAKGIKVTAEFATGEAVLDYVRPFKGDKMMNDAPDVILMDIQMPGIGGIEATRKIVRILPDVQIIALTALNVDPFPSALMKAGAAGFLTKDCGAEEMIRAIRMVKSGQRYISPAIAQQLALRSLSPKKEQDLTELLSDRELQVMMMITRGSKVQQISEKLCLSPKTVNSYRYRIFEKLSIESDVELTHMAIRLGLIENFASQPGLAEEDK